MNVSGIFAFSVSLFLLAGNVCGAEQPAVKTGKQLVAEAKESIQEVDIAQLKEQLAQGAVLIDVREPHEFEAGHIPEATLVPRGRLEFDIVDVPALALLTPEEMRSQPIVLYCRSGGRSALAAQSLESMGFTNVQSLQGGIKAWREAAEGQEHPAEE